MLNVSANTLDKWIERGRVNVVRNPSTGRLLVETTHLAVLLNAVRQLRQAGQQEGLLAAAIQKLEREDPQYAEDFDELYGGSIAAMQRDDLKPFAVPAGFGPED